MSTSKDTLRLFWHAALQHPKQVWIGSLYPLGVILTSIGIPYYIGQVLAAITTHPDNATKFVVLLAVCSAAGNLLNRVSFLQILRLQALVMRDLQHRSLAALLNRSVGFHNDRVSGKLVSDAIDFPNAFSMAVGAIVINGIPFTLTILIGLVLVAIHSWVMGLALLFIIVFIGIWTYLESVWRSKLRSRRLKAVKAVTSHLSDTIVNAQTVKAFAREPQEIARNLKLGDRLSDLRIQDWQRSSRSATNRMSTLLAFQVAFIILAITLVRRDPGLLGVSIFAFTYTLTIMQRLFDITNISRQLEEALLQASPMTAVLLEDIEVKDAPGAPELAVTRGEIVLDDVHFHYDAGKNSTGVFTGLSLNVKPGEKIGLVGPSGGGKSTLTRLLLRFEDLTSGRILFDGQDIAQVTQGSLRSAIAYVAQEPLLFHRTIRENIAYGQPEATDAAVIAAAKQANADDFIQALPAGYDTVVGERGVKLSGGQRQRVAIARAILKDAPILLLDEATSALDSESESLVQDALWKLMKGRTTLVIAHRLSTIQKMDRILVLQQGRIVEEGSHQQLVTQKGGVYASLWNHQSGGFVQDDIENTLG